MASTYINENSRERERLRRLVNDITDKELTLIIYQEGWTIASMLAHLAFWDHFRLQLVRKWQQQGVSPTVIDDDLLNDTLLSFFLELTPRKAANMAVAMAEKIDDELEHLSPDMTNAIMSLGERHALNRSIHRKMHLDEIEILLKTNREKKKSK
jgi:hypothetical protein